MTESLFDRDPVEALAEEYMERKRRGESPSVAEYEQQHPELADQIRELFPALEMMEDFKPSMDSTGDSGGKIDVGSTELKVKQLGDYHILREIGHGGMGVVYEAEQISLGRRVALKVLPEQMIKKDTQRRRFEREARAAAKLHHTNIVPVFGVGEQDGMRYYVMQFIQGLGIDEVIDELRRIHSGKAAPDQEPDERLHGSPEGHPGSGKGRVGQFPGDGCEQDTDGQ